MFELSLNATTPPPGLLHFSLPVGSAAHVGNEIGGGDGDEGVEMAGASWDGGSGMVIGIEGVDG